MPYARKRSYSARPYAKRTRLFGKRRTVRRPRARSLNVRTAGFLGAELKFLDSARANVSLTSAIAGSEIDNATALCLNGIIQGTGQSERDGRQYIMKSIQVNGIVFVPVANDKADAPPNSSVRILLIMDKQTNGVQFSAENVLDATIADNANAFRKLEFSRRFDILAEKRLNLDRTTSHNDAVATGSYTGQCKAFSFYKKLDVKVNCTATAATVASISDNSLHLMAITQNGDATITWSSRLRFVG